MWSIMVALPAMQADFGVTRADASLPFTMVMIGFAGGGILMGRLADRFGIAVPLSIGTLALSAGYLGDRMVVELWQVALAHGLIGIGCSASFGPLMADISHWFVRDAALPSRSPLPEIISPARYGRRLCSTSFRPTAGARRISASGCSVSSRCCRLCSGCAGESKVTIAMPPPRPLRSGKPKCRSHR